MPVLLKNYGFVAANPVRASTRQRRQVPVNAPGATHRCLARTETNNPTALAGPSAWPQCMLTPLNWMAQLGGPATRHLGGDQTFVSITTACGNITTSRFVLTQPGAIHEGHRSLKFSRHRHGHQPFPPPCCGSSIAGSPSAHPAGSRLQYHTWLRARLITGQDTATALWLAPEDAAGQNSAWKAHATANRVHSCSFVVQNDPREAPSGQISGWKAHATASRVHSWFKTTPLRFTRDHRG